MNESHRHSFHCQSLTPLALNDSLSFNTYYGCWLWIVITCTTYIGTLSGLGNLGVVATLELTGLVLNMLYTLVFLGHSPDLC